MKKIACFYDYDFVKEKFQERFGDKVLFLKGNVQDFSFREEFREVEVISVFISSTLNKENLDKFPNLKLINTRSTGTDHINLEYAQSKNIKVENIKAYGDQTVAEFTIALLLAIAKKVVLAYQETLKRKNFSARGLHKFEGFDLNGKKIGIIGTGRIGKRVALIAKGFGMKVLLSDIYPDKDFAQENGFTYVERDILLREADIISLHTPLCPETKHFIATKEFAQMKDGVIILNTARGALIETQALWEALKSGKVA